MVFDLDEDPQPQNPEQISFYWCATVSHRVDGVPAVVAGRVYRLYNEPNPSRRSEEEYCYADGGGYRLIETILQDEGWNVGGDGGGIVCDGADDRMARFVATLIREQNPALFFHIDQAPDGTWQYRTEHGEEEAA